VPAAALDILVARSYRAGVNLRCIPTFLGFLRFLSFLKF
jgi:hypothetical protein